jgi:hypothetical protein
MRFGWRFVKPATARRCSSETTRGTLSRFSAAYSYATAFPLSSYVRSISHSKMRAGSSGSAMRLFAVVPNVVVTLSPEIVRQKTPPAPATRSMRVNPPSMRGR